MNIFYKVLVMLFLNGVTAMLAQTILFKEIFNQVYVNELVLSSILAVWLVSGAFAAGFIFDKYFRNRGDSFLNTALGLFPVVNSFLLVILVVFIRYYKRIFSIPEELAVSNWDALLLSIFVTAPVSCLLGLVFSTGAEILRRGRAEKSAKSVYIAEDAGAMLVGVLYMLFISENYSDLQVLYVTGIVNMAAVYLLFRDRTKDARVIMLAVIISLIAYLGFSMAGFLAKTDLISSRALFSKYTVIADKEYPTVKLTVAKRENTYYIFENGAISYAIPDTRFKEASFWPYLAHENNSSVLVVNGGLAGMVEELSRFNGVKEITSVELDPYTAAVMEAVFKPGIKTDKKTTYGSGDIIYYLNNRKDKAKYDTVILNLRQPNTIYGNRLFTKEFFELVKSNLNPGGMLSFQLPSGEDYLSAGKAAAAASVYKAVKAVFKEVKIIPGDSCFILGSDSEIKLSAGGIMKKMENEKIKEPVFNRAFVEDRLNPARVAKLEAAVSLPKTAMNRIFSPAAYISFLRTDMDLFKDKKSGIKILIIAAFFLLLSGNVFDLKVFRKNPAPYISLLIIGGAAMATELVLVTAFQSLYGYLYKAVSMLLALFMLGLLAGALISYLVKSIKVSHAGAFLILTNALVIGYIFTFRGFAAPAGYGLITILIIASGAAAGAAFNAAAGPAETGMLYSFDMLGGAFGALLFCLFVLPVFGLTGALILNIIMVTPVLFAEKK